MEELTTFLKELPAQLTPIATAVGVICLIVAAIMMMTGTDNAGKAKKWIMYICAAVALVFFAVAIVASIQSMAE